MEEKLFSNWKDKVLFTPGPLTTSKTVKSAMLRDLGSRDYEFMDVVQDIQRRLLQTAGVQKGEYEVILMQGSGTFGVESIITTSVPRDGKMLVIINGAYGKRIKKMAEILCLNHSVLSYSENEIPSLYELKNTLETDKDITNVAVVHCETTTGIMNPIYEIGEVVKEYGKTFFIDAMSSYGAVPVDFSKCKADYLISSSNKCIEGVPGFSFIFAKTEELKKTENNAASLVFDLYDQWKEMEETGQFRFSPPTHQMLAFHRALIELENEGGVEARSKRYEKNNTILYAGMEKLGFKFYLEPEKRGIIITSFLYPEHPNFNFEQFYEILNSKGYVIYPGKLSEVDCFRIGNIGRIFENDIYDLLAAIKSTMVEMEMNLTGEAE